MVHDQAGGKQENNDLDLLHLPTSDILLGTPVSQIQPDVWKPEVLLISYVVSLSGVHESQVEENGVDLEKEMAMMQHIP